MSDGILHLTYTKDILAIIYVKLCLLLGEMKQMVYLIVPPTQTQKPLAQDTSPRLYFFSVEKTSTYNALRHLTTSTKIHGTVKA